MTTIPERWFIASFSETPSPFTLTFIVTTDAPCHLWCRHSKNPPQTHKRPVLSRGTYEFTDVYFCFTAYTDLEQQEPGDTLIHTFVLTPWASCQTRYFYFHGTIAGVPSPSTSPVFGRHLFTTEHAYTLQLSHPDDEITQFAGLTLSCPTYCPNFAVVGRWQKPAMKIGSGLRFRNFQVPRYTIINVAYLILTCSDSRHITNVWCRVSAENTSTPDDWYGADVSELFTRYLNRTGIVDWNNIPAWTPEVQYSSPNIKSTIQAIVNRADWQSGNALSLFWEDFDHRTPWGWLSTRFAYSYTASPVKAPYLSLSYTEWNVEEVT